MGLTRVDRERISDSRLKIQSVTDTLHHLDKKKLPNLDAIQDCLEDAERTLSGALHSDN